MVMADKQTAKAEEPLTVEGVWEIISVSSDEVRDQIGRKVSISHKGDSYEVKSINKNRPSKIYSGNERRIVNTELVYVIEPTTDDWKGDRAPPLVYQQLAGKQVRVSDSYTLSADGNFLTRVLDTKNVYWKTNKQTGKIDDVRYEVIPNDYKYTLKRVSGPIAAKKPLTSAIAQVESRGEFYVLTKDGRKLTGKDTNQISLEEGTKVITGSSGHIRMKLPDDTTFTIGPNSNIVIDSFVYDPDNTPKKVIANMSKGVFRWVTGKAKPLNDPAELKVKLPVMAVGIRGTDFEAAVNPDGSGSVVLHFGQLEITENKTGFRFIMNAGYKITFKADGTVSRPIKGN